MAGAQVGKRTVGSLMKRAWNEIPEVAGATAGGIVGLGFTGIALYIYQKKDLSNRRFKLVPTVVRPDDPRAKYARYD